MRYDEFDLYCSLPETIEVFKEQGFIRGKQEEDSGSKSIIKEKVKREKHHELQCFNIPEIFSDSHGIHIASCYKKYEGTYEIIFHG